MRRPARPFAAALAIGEATLREGLRSRLLLAGLAFALLLGLLLAAVASLGIFERQHLVFTVGLSAISALSALTGIATICGLFGSSLFNDEANACWVRPLARPTWVVGRFGGLLLTVTLLQLCMAAATAAALLDAGGELSYGLAVALFAAWLELCMVMGLTAVLCCVTRPVSASIWSSALLLLCLVGDQLERPAAGPAWLRAILPLVHALLPDLRRLRLIGEASNGQPLPPGWWLQVPPYAFFYVAACMLACMLLLRGRRPR